MSTLELFPTDDAVDAIPRPPEALDTSNTNNEKLFDSDAVLAQLFSMGFPIEASAEVVEQVGKRAVEAGDTSTDTIVNACLSILIGSSNNKAQMQIHTTPKSILKSHSNASLESTSPVQTSPSGNNKSFGSWITSSFSNVVGKMRKNIAIPTPLMDEDERDFSDDDQLLHVDSTVSVSNTTSPRSSNASAGSGSSASLNNSANTSPKQPKQLKRVRFSNSDLVMDFDASQSSSSAARPVSPMNVADVNGVDQVKKTTVVDNPSATTMRYSPQDALQVYLRDVDKRGDVFIERIVSILESCTSDSGVEFDLSGVTISRKNVCSLSELLCLNFGLKSVNLDRCGLEDDTIKLILNGLLTSDTVKTLSLANNTKLKSTGAKWIAIYLRKSKSLCELDLSGTVFDARGLGYLGKAFFHPRTKTRCKVQTIKFDKCFRFPVNMNSKQGNSSANVPQKHPIEEFAAKIRQSRILNLSLRTCRLAPTMGRYISDLIRDEDSQFHPNDSAKSDSLNNSQTTTHHRGLFSLNLSQNALGSALVDFSQTLALNRSLTCLVLSQCQLEPDMIYPLAEALKLNNTLQYLDLSHNPLCTPNDLSAITSLKECLTINKSLLKLSLASTHLNSEGCITISEAFPLNTAICELDLSGNEFDMAGLMAITVSLRLNTSIVDLSVGIRNTQNDEIVAQYLLEINNVTRKNKETVPLDKLKKLEELNNLVSMMNAPYALEKDQPLVSIEQTITSFVPEPLSPIPSLPVPQEHEEERDLMSMDSQQPSIDFDSLEQLVRLFEDMILVRDEDNNEMLRDLYQQCCSQKDLVVATIRRVSAASDDTELVKLLEWNDKLTNVITRYEELMNKQHEREAPGEQAQELPPPSTDANTDTVPKSGLSRSLSVDTDDFLQQHFSISDSEVPTPDEGKTTEDALKTESMTNFLEELEKLDVKEDEKV